MPIWIWQADAAVSAGFGAAGQRCMAVSVLVAVGSIGDALVEKIQQRIPNVAIGAAHEEGIELGPVISEDSKNRIHSLLASAETEGASLAADGRCVDDEHDGWVVGASLVDHVKPNMEIYQKEVFGTVLSVVRVGTCADAMELIAEHPMGNGSAIFTSDGGAARQFADSVQAGMVVVNVPIPVPAFSHSFGGWKDSAFTETKLSGPEALSFYTCIKAITTRWEHLPLRLGMRRLAEN